MFEAFHNAADGSATRRLVVPTLVSAGVYCLLGTCVAIIAARSVAPAIKALSVDVTFRPPPPLAPVEAPPPVARPALKVRPKPGPLPTAPAAAPMLAPEALPQSPPPEVSADQAVAAIVVAVGGQGDGSGTAIGVAALGDRVTAAVAPINLPESAVAPAAATDNAAPAYPDEARASGQEGLVVLKIVVLADGSVGRVQVLKGDEPFVAAALAAVRTWRYSPALVEGRPTSVFRIVKMPFRLNR
jgi:protein TonB